jgi:hypothetical protein
MIFVLMYHRHKRLDLINSSAALMGSRYNNNNGKNKDQDQVGIMLSDHQKTWAEEQSTAPYTSNVLQIIANAVTAAHIDNSH